MEFLKIISICTCFIVMLLSFEAEAGKPKKCWLVRAEGFHKVICDSRRIARSKSPNNKSKRTNKYKDRSAKKQKFNLKMLKCTDMSGELVEKDAILTSLPALYSVTCPPSSFLQEMKLKSVETQYQMTYKCCNYVAILKR